MDQPSRKGKEPVPPMPPSVQEVGLYDEEEKDGREMAIKTILVQDDKLEFVSLMNSWFGTPVSVNEDLDQVVLTQKNYCPLWISELICRGDAVECLTALLNGETGLEVDLNIPFKDGSYPLHIAALNLSYDMVELLLSHGALADIPTIECEAFRANVLPLNVALETLRNHQYLVGWTEKQSIFKLIVLLCLPELMLAVDICRLLAQNTQEVNEIFNHYAMEGNVIEMAALLMVAQEKVLAPNMLQNADGASVIESLTLKERIGTEITILSLYEMKLMHESESSNLLMICKKMKILWTNSMLLLEVFETAGDKIETYIQFLRSHKPQRPVMQDIKALMKKVGFLLKDKDIDLSDIHRGREDIMLPTGVFGKGTSASQIWSFSVPNISPAGSSPDEKMAPISNEKKKTGWKTTTFSPYSCMDLPPSSKIFPWRETKDDKGGRSFEPRSKPMRMRQMPGARFFSVISNIRKVPLC